MKKQFWRFTLVLTLALASFLVVSAQVRPVMTVYAVWTPDEQLTSVSVPTLDERFVDLQIYAQGNVPFWAVNLSCIVGSTTILELVSLTFPQEWGTLNTDYYYSPQTPSELYTGFGTLSFTATRLGATNTQLGLNGQDFTQLLATARFKVKDLAANTRAIVSCTVMEFIDRNGNLAIRARQVRYNDLQIYVGYTLTGTALRQGTRFHQNIEVTCGLLGQPATNQTVFTLYNGSFRFGGSLNSSTALRHFGLYRCTFVSEYLQGIENAQILQSYVDFELNTATKNLMPVLLRAGDADENNTIDFDDILEFTFVPSAAVSPFTNLDMNGDGQRNRTDIVLTAANIGLGDTSPGFLNDHIIYSMGRDLDPLFTYPNSRIYLGSTQSADISIINSHGRARDFWGQLSPDGTEIAHITQDARTGVHYLAIMTVSNGLSRIIRFPYGVTDHAFAPSWSPDGNRIAFICTPDNTTGFRYNRGDICIMNAADRFGSNINRLGVQSRIFPPTWLPYEDGFVLLYGGVDGDIHYYDFVSSSHGILALGDAASADVLDMPVVVNYAYNDTAYLAYRFNDNDATFDPYLRIGSIDFDGTSFSGEALDIIDADHVSLSATTTGLDYFDVSPSMDILFYREYNFAKTNFPSQDPFIFVNLPHNDSSVLTWFGATEYIPDSSVGNLITTDFGTTYTPGSSSPTFLHVWRMSFDYIP